MISAASPEATSGTALGGGVAGMTGGAGTCGGKKVLYYIQSLEEEMANHTSFLV